MPRFTSGMQWLPAVSALVLLLSLPAIPAAAQVGSDRYASIVMDSGSGNVLSAASADEPRYPASLTKMMTLYMLFDALRDRRVSLEQQVPVSPWAASMSPTRLGLVPGTYITVEQAILGLVTKSANDAAAALGEMLGGDEERFAQMMTLRARALGMTHTTFRNASGLPDPDQMTTARDMAVLARHLVQDHPAYYRYFSAPSFVFHGRLIPNHQHMLQTYPGVDGLKTGYIRDSGYNMVTSAVHGDTRLIGVVLGAANSGERDQHMAALLDAGFDRAGAPMLLARHDPAPSFGLPAIIAAAQAAPSYPPPLYSAPYTDVPGPRYQLGYDAPFLPPPSRFRSYAARFAEPRLAPQPVRLRAGGPGGRDPAWREPPGRTARDPAARRMMDRTGPRDRFEIRDRREQRAERLRVRPVMAAPPVQQRTHASPARGYDAAPRPVRSAHAAWPGGRYPG